MIMLICMTSMPLLTKELDYSEMNEYNLMRDKSFSVPALLLLNEQPEQNDKYIKN